MAEIAFPLVDFSDLFRINIKAEDINVSSKEGETQGQTDISQPDYAQQKFLFVYFFLERLKFLPHDCLNFFIRE